MFGQQLGRAGRRLAQQTNTASRCQQSQWASRLETAPLRRQQRRAYSAPGEAASAAAASAAAAGGQRAGTGTILRKAATYALVGAAFSAIGAAAAWKTLTAHGLGFYSDEESLLRFNASEVDDEARRVEETINAHPLVAELRRRPELKESRPHMKMPAQYSGRSLTGGALVGPGKVPVPAFCWTEEGGKSFVSVVYVGDNLCGHPGIIHGGLLATMLDEGLAWACFPALPHNIGVTAYLNINYRKPAPAGSFLVLRAETTKVEGRKAWVKGHIELLADPGEKPTILTEAEALYVSPKYAAMMPRIHS